MGVSPCSIRIWKFSNLNSVVCCQKFLLFKFTLKYNKQVQYIRIYLNKMNRQVLKSDGKLIKRNDYDVFVKITEIIFYNFIQSSSEEKKCVKNHI